MRHHPLRGLAGFQADPVALQLYLHYRPAQLLVDHPRRSVHGESGLAVQKASAGYGQAPMFDTEVMVASRPAVLVMLPSKG